MRKYITLFVTLLVCTSISAQSLADKRALKKIESELSKLERDLSINESKSRYIVPDTAAIYALKAKYEAEKASGLMAAERYIAIDRQIANLNERLVSARTKNLSEDYRSLRSEHNAITLRIAELENNRELLIDKQYDVAKNDKSPKELSPRESSRRERGYWNARRDLGLEKMNSICTPSNGNNQGYLGLIWNKTLHTPANFIICDASGQKVDGASFYLAPGEKVEIYLLPGQYIGKNTVYGRDAGSTVFTSEPKVAGVNGKQYCWYLIKDNEGF